MVEERKPDQEEIIIPDGWKRKDVQIMTFTKKGRQEELERVKSIMESDGWEFITFIDKGFDIKTKAIFKIHLAGGELPQTKIEVISSARLKAKAIHKPKPDSKPELEPVKASESQRGKEPLPEWVVILLLFCCFPIGLYLMWQYKYFTLNTRVLITVGLAVLAVIGIAVPAPTPTATHQPATVSAPVTPRNIKDVNGHVWRTLDYPTKLEYGKVLVTYMDVFRKYDNPSKRIVDGLDAFYSKGKMLDLCIEDAAVLIGMSLQSK